MRMYPYLTGRILSRVERLGVGGVRRDQARGTHRRVRLSPRARRCGVDRAGPVARRGGGLSAASGAASWQRAALDPRRCREQLRQEARAGHLDGESVEAVLAAAGHRSSRRAPFSAGLTAREVEVLRLVAQGRSNREIADRAVHCAENGTQPRRACLRQVGVNNRTQAS